jgi:putative exporter of polyketide antibiotics
MNTVACGQPDENRMKDEATEAAIAGVAQKVSFGAGTAAVYGGLTANEIAAFGGLLVAIVGVIVQWVYKRKENRRGIAADKRAVELHEAQLQALRDESREYGDGGL